MVLNCLNKLNSANFRSAGCDAAFRRLFLYNLYLPGLFQPKGAEKGRNRDDVICWEWTVDWCQGRSGSGSVTWRWLWTWPLSDMILLLCWFLSGIYVSHQWVRCIGEQKHIYVILHNVKYE